MKASSVGSLQDNHTEITAGELSDDSGTLREAKEVKDVVKTEKAKEKSNDDSHASFEAYYRGFQTMFMIGYMIHCRKKEDNDHLYCVLLCTTFLLAPNRGKDLTFGAYILLILKRLCNCSPRCANHTNMIAFVGILLLPQQVGRILYGTSQWTNETWALVRTIVIGLYVMAGFHKINSTFLFVPEKSCAFDKIEWYLEHILGADPLARLPVWLGIVLPPSVIILEMVPPLLLLVPRWRKTGMLLIIKLHAILLPVGFTDFGSIAQSFLWTFVSPQALQDAKLPPHFFAHMLLVFIAFESLVVAHRFSLGDFDRNDYRREEVGLVYVAYAFLWYKILRPADRSPVQMRLPRSLPSWFALTFFVFFVLNPYLGLRTVGNLTMFSNLRTDGPESNHLLLRSNPLKIFRLQDDVVEILDADERFDDYSKPKIVPGFMVQRLWFDRILLSELQWAEDYPNLYLKIRYEGEILETEDLNYDAAFDRFRLDQEPWWSKVYLGFRIVPISREPEGCTW